MNITIIQLYPDDMNLYGDWGNVLTLKKRLEWRGHSVAIVNHNVGDETDFTAGDIFIGGGGQDAGQMRVQDDLMKHAPILKQLAHSGTPMLLICGMYQLFGREFITSADEVIRGTDILPITTRASQARLTGNIILQSREFGEIIGYENHSGRTFLDAKAEALGAVLQGAGNNGDDGHEGLRFQNIIATYLHGPILPKNPRMADFLIQCALEKHNDTTPLEPLTEIDALAARAVADAKNAGR